jgi:hypothetical protein
MSRVVSATQAKLHELLAEERRLNAEIEQRETRRKTVRQTLERVRLVLNGQQALPLAGCEPDVPAPRPPTLRKLSPLQRSVLFAAVEAKGAPYQPASPETRRSATSLEQAGLLEWSLHGETVAPTQAGIDLHDEILARAGAAKTS